MTDISESPVQVTGEIRQYKLANFDGIEIVLEVDHSILTAEKAAVINSFWGGDDDRLSYEDGDVVRAVVKLAAKTIAGGLLADGGGSVYSQESVEMVTRLNLHRLEGWGGSIDGSDFGWCGIRLVSAEVEVDLDLEFQEDEPS